MLSDLSEQFNENTGTLASVQRRIEHYTISEIQAICIADRVYPETVKWYLNYVLTIKKANGSSHSMVQGLLSAKCSFNLLYDTKEAAYAAIGSLQGRDDV